MTKEVSSQDEGKGNGDVAPTQNEGRGNGDVAPTCGWPRNQDPHGWSYQPLARAAEPNGWGDVIDPADPGGWRAYMQSFDGWDPTVNGAAAYRERQRRSLGNAGLAVLQALIFLLDVLVFLAMEMLLD